MKKIITIEPLASLTTNMWKFRVLVASLKLNVFDAVQDVHGINEIASELELGIDPLEKLLNALVAMELLEKNENSYYLIKYEHYYY